MSSAWQRVVDATVLDGERAAVVLLSGGMDSVACLHMAAAVYGAHLAAVAVDYGQPHRDRELACAQHAAETLGVRWERIAVADALSVLRPAERMANAPHGSVGPHPATVPLRNHYFHVLAAMRGLVWFPGLPLDLWIGACLDDVGHFVDCHPDAIAESSRALTFNAGSPIRVVAPLLTVTKRDLVHMAAEQPGALEAIRQSWSCYRGRHVPCGECTPCVLRIDAFASAGLDDHSQAHPMVGGDPHREVRR